MRGEGPFSGLRDGVFLSSRIRDSGLKFYYIRDFWISSFLGSIKKDGGKRIYQDGSIL
jgi:hypothetical protein